MLNVQNPYPKGEDKSPKVVYDAAAVVDLDHRQFDVTVKLEVLLLKAIFSSKYCSNSIPDFVISKRILNKAKEV